MKKNAYTLCVSIKLTVDCSERRKRLKKKQNWVTLDSGFVLLSLYEGNSITHTSLIKSRFNIQDAPRSLYVCVYNLFFLTIQLSSPIPEAHPDHHCIIFIV